MDFVKIDLDEIERAVAVYEECKVELEEMAMGLSVILEELQTKWKGTACIRFFDENGQLFLSSINTHLNQIEALRKELYLLSEAFRLLDHELVNRFE